MPCMHNFCNSCIADWMTKSSECPSCRKAIVETKKNTFINNIITHYLDANPDKKRPAEEYSEMDKNSN